MEIKEQHFNIILENFDRNGFVSHFAGTVLRGA